MKVSPMQGACALLFCAIATATVSCTTTSGSSSRNGEGVVTGTYYASLNRGFRGDGETIVLVDGLQPFSVRLWGIDAAEIDTTASDAASDFLQGFAEDEVLTCEVPPDGRTADNLGVRLRLCRLPDGRDVAALLVTAGHAKDLTEVTGGRYSTTSGD